MSQHHYDAEPPDTSGWTPYQYEQLIRRCDAFAHRYLKLQQRFGEFPHADELIDRGLAGQRLPHLDENFFFFVDEADLGHHHLQDPSEDEGPADGEGDVPGDGEHPPHPAPFYYETYPPYKLLLQVAIGWCNIFATLLHPEHRPHGVRILFHLGRALSFFGGALGDGFYERPALNIACAKRSLAEVNTAIGAIGALESLHGSYAGITPPLKNHLREVHDRLIDHLDFLHSRQDTRTDDDLPF